MAKTTGSERADTVEDGGGTAGAGAGGAGDDGGAGVGVDGDAADQAGGREGSRPRIEDPRDCGSESSERLGRSYGIPF